jgi:hypothetical protein
LAFDTLLILSVINNVFILALVQVAMIEEAVIVFLQDRAAASLTSDAILINVHVTIRAMTHPAPMYLVIRQRTVTAPAVDVPVTTWCSGVHALAIKSTLLWSVMIPVRVPDSPNRCFRQRNQFTSVSTLPQSLWEVAVLYFITERKAAGTPCGPPMIVVRHRTIRRDRLCGLTLCLYANDDSRVVITVIVHVWTLTPFRGVSPQTNSHLVSVLQQEAFVIHICPLL